MDVVIYHNPDCGTSRNTLALIRNAGLEPHVIEYLKTPPSRAMLKGLVTRMSVPLRSVIREKGTPFAELGLADETLSDDDLLDAITAHPVLLNRPIVVTPRGVRLCRPSEEVVDLLPPQRGEFVKEDGGASPRARPARGVRMSAPAFSASRRLTAEALGTGLLVASVVGSGIMAERLAGGNVAIALLGNTIPTGAILVVLILALAPISGAHFNPAVSLIMGLTGGLARREVAPYILAQVVGGCLGTLAAHAMFELPLFQLAAKARTGPAQWFAEFVATFGLLITIASVARFRSEAIPFAVGLYITAAYWFTASTSFANPAVTIARALTDTFAGIAPNHVIPFVIAQLAGALAGFALTHWLLKNEPSFDSSRNTVDGEPRRVQA